MRVHIDKVIKHLRTQIAVSDGIGSDFVYITKREAEKCLELAEAESTLLKEPVYAERQSNGETWWYNCGECGSPLKPTDKYCSQCGLKIIREK